MVSSGVKYKWLYPLERSRSYNYSATKVTTNTVPLVRVSGRGLQTSRERDVVELHAVQRYAWPSGCWKWFVTFQKIALDGCEGVRSDTEVGYHWLLGRLKIAPDLSLGRKHSNSTTTTIKLNVYGCDFFFWGTSVHER